MSHAIPAEGLVTRFKETTAQAGCLAARSGTVLGVLGPHGAGEDRGGAHPGDPAAAGRRPCSRRRPRRGGGSRRRARPGGLLIGTPVSEPEQVMTL